ncbi:hypothetical protein CP968_16605 [Streptomyces subrutilus]|uniref:Uncharacterized protein n=1 Tax=Streptomyces subrutilus TaxID=36818 RepID=A0A5P2UQF2_9ACTN|nr:hypothetical protein CP968_16605 [Streptomyces subrutilus]
MSSVTFGGSGSAADAAARVVGQASIIATQAASGRCSTTRCVESTDSSTHPVPDSGTVRATWRGSRTRRSPGWRINTNGAAGESGNTDSSGPFRSSTPSVRTTRWDSRVRVGSVRRRSSSVPLTALPSSTGPSSILRSASRTAGLGRSSRS